MKGLAPWGEEIARNARRLNSDFKDLDLSNLPYFDPCQ
jgi:hypothetical protein